MRAIVLRKKSFAEADLLVDFFTDKGVFKAFAPKAKKSRRRFPHQFHPAGLYEVSWARQPAEGQLTRIQSCELLNWVPRLTQDLTALARWSIVAEWVCRDPISRASFEMLQNLMEKLPEQEGLHYYYQFFIETIFWHGLEPKLESCVICSKNLSFPLGFSLKEGGVGHHECLSEFVPLSSEAHHYLKAAFTGNSLGMPPSELENVFVPFLLHQLGWELKSFRGFQKLA